MSATSAYDILESVPRRSSSGNPWTKSVPVSSSATPATSLADVMSEQLATALEKQNDSGVPGLENRECKRGIAIVAFEEVFPVFAGRRG